MVNVLDMKDIRYLNLFHKITKVQTRYCFLYNESIVFTVPRPLVSKAIGKDGVNVKKMHEILGKKIKVIPTPDSIGDSKESITEFVERIVSPVTFKDIEVTENEVLLTAGPQNKAALIGRQRRREHELKEIIRDYFRKDLRIV